MRATIVKLPWWWAFPAIVVGFVIGWWHPGEDSGVMAALEGRLLDLRHVVRGPVAPPDEFVIVAIDDKTLGRLQQRLPIPREALAQAVNRLTDARAKVVAIDLLLLGNEPTADPSGVSPGDRALAEAIRRHGSVVLAATQADDVVPDEVIVRSNDFGQTRPGAGSAKRPSGEIGLMLPIQAFATAGIVGQVNLIRSADGAIRRMALAMPVGTRAYLPAMPLEVVRLLRGLPRSDLRLAVGESVTLGAQDIPVGLDNSIPIRQYGGQGAFTTYSLIDVIDGKVPPDRFDGRAVFIGVTALAAGDVFPSPFAPQLSGVEVLAATAANIAHDQYLRRTVPTFAIDAVLAVALAVLAYFAANQRSLSVSLGSTVALWGIAFVGVQIAFSRFDLWLDATTFIFALGSSGLITLAARIVQQRMISGQVRSERDNLARYHSPLLTEFLAEQEQPSFSERPQQAAVMFVDVAGFTRRAERLGPSATVDFLRELHGRIERAALANHGVIEQFMGDGAMIIFGLPEPAADDAARALDATRQLVESLGDWNLDLEALGEEPVRIRVGLHFGPVIAALVGGALQGQVTVAGDTVNVASRLQEMGKEHKAAIIASAEFVANVLHSGRQDLLHDMRRLIDQQIRGRDELIDLWVWP